MKILQILLSALLISTQLFSNDIYRAVKPLPFDGSGYFACESPLDQIFKAKEIKTVIELGSWAGASTRFFGYRVGSEGKVYAIDHWKGTSNHHGEMIDPRLPYIFHLFLSNIIHAGLQDRIVPIRMTTDEAHRALNIKADLVYVDASRDHEQVYQDIINWSTHLNPGGVICGAEYREPQVRQGVMRAAEELGKEVYTSRKGFFWGFR